MLRQVLYISLLPPRYEETQYKTQDHNFKDIPADKIDGIIQKRPWVSDIVGPVRHDMDYYRFLCLEL